MSISLFCSLLLKECSLLVHDFHLFLFERYVLHWDVVEHFLEVLLVIELVVHGATVLD